MTLEMREDDAAFLRGPRGNLVRPRGFVRVVDLFSGCGGLTLGIEEAARARRFALDIRLAVESDENVAAVYTSNFGSRIGRWASDVEACFDRRPGAPLSSAENATRSSVGRNLDVLVGGPPCQGHSTLNNHTRGDDPKNRLYLSMVRAAEILRPAVVLVENVPAVERDRKKVVTKAKAMLEEFGYGVDTAVVAMVDIGVPQLRKRHVLVGVRDGAPNIHDAIQRSATRKARDLAWAIGDLRGVRRSGLDQPAVMAAENLERARYLLRWDRYDLPNRLRPRCQRNAHKYKSMYGRLRWDGPAQTITTGFGSPGQGRYLHPDEPRTLTAHEAARLQFFPDWFDFGALRGRRELARAIGNAVPPKLAFVLASHFIAFENVSAPTARATTRKNVGRQLVLLG
jgi:DNA (cytosine-5)-methyltransferase 1